MKQGTLAFKNPIVHASDTFKVSSSYSRHLHDSYAEEYPNSECLARAELLESLDPKQPKQEEVNLGSKRHIIVDAQGIPLVVLVSGANRHDSKMFEQCLDAIPAVKGLQGRPRRRPYKLHADKGYDYARCRAHLRKRGILSRIARRGVESSEKLGKHRWVVERTHGWFAGFGKLRIRFERRLDIHLALLKLAAAIICARFADRLC